MCQQSHHVIPLAFSVEWVLCNLIIRPDYFHRRVGIAIAVGVVLLTADFKKEKFQGNYCHTRQLRTLPSMKRETRFPGHIFM